MSAPLHVVKLGGSVLRDDGDLARAASELYRRRRAGQRVLAVVSALYGETDRLQAAARDRLGEGGAPAEPQDDGTRHALAAHLATGESAACARLALALARCGVEATLLDAGVVGLVAEGPVLEARPTGLDRRALQGAIDRTGLALLPGFVARDDAGRPVLLGRGGSDWTALFCAHALGADDCTLVKDVPGLFEWDPALPGPAGARPRRFTHATFASAERLAGEVLQPRAVVHARALGRTFAVGALGDRRPTRVGAPADVLEAPREAAPPLRVTLLGAGTVGGGLLRHLLARPDAYRVVGALVRDAARTRPHVPPGVALDDDARALLARPSDVVVEALGGPHPARELVLATLDTDRHVVSANKALLAEHGEELAARARARGRQLLGGAAVGGSVPCLEALARDAGPGAFELEAVLNGTATWVLEAVAGGQGLEDALLGARTAGLCERDAELDLSGLDAAHKLVLLARVAGLGPATPEDVRRWGRVDGRVAPAGRVRRQVARAYRDGTGTRLEVGLEDLSPAHPLARTSGAACVLRWRRDRGPWHELRGRGAGRWPTAEALLADLEDLRTGSGSAVDLAHALGGARVRAGRVGSAGGGR